MTSTNALPIFIGHNDTLLNLYLPERSGGRNFFTRSDQGHIDLPRAREAGLGGGFFVEHLGIDYVGLGSDFDGTRIPREIGDVTGLPKLITALRDHGYDVALRKLAYENWVRVLNNTWR